MLDDYFGDQYFGDVEPHLKDCKFVATSYTEVRDSGFTQKSHRLSGVYPLNEQLLLAYMEDYFWKPYDFTLLMHCWNKFFRRDIVLANQLRLDDRLFNSRTCILFAVICKSARSECSSTLPKFFHVVDSNGAT